LDTATGCPTFTFGFSPAVVTVREPGLHPVSPVIGWLAARLGWVPQLDR
jgi:hypothetical protein